MSPFEPKGDEPVWQVLYKRLAEAEVGDVLTYEELGELIDSDRAAVQSAVRRAGKELLVADHRAIDAVRSVGYRIIQPEEHLDLARRHQRKSNRALSRGSTAVTHVDLTNVSAEVRQAFSVVAQAFSLQMDFNKRFDVRQRKLEEQLATINPVVERSAEEIEQLKARLAALESEGKQT